jgi:hypothetical protein
MILGALEIVETFFGFIFYFIPYWDVLRIGMFVWLLQFNGAEFVFGNVLQPLLKEHRDVIMQYISKATHFATDATNSVKDQAAKAAADPMNLVKLAGAVQEGQKFAQDQLATEAPQEATN